VTHDHQALIAALTRALEAEARIESAWLSASLGADDGDAWSDVDVTVVADASAIPDVLRELAAAPPLAPAHSFALHGRILSAVTAEWIRYDILLLTPQEFTARDPPGLKPLFQRPGAATPAGAPAQSRPASDGDLEAGAREFLRILGLGTVMFGREDYLMGVEGAMLLRAQLIDLMLAENGRARSERSVKRVTQLLSAAQRAEVCTLPPLAATRESLRAYNAAIAALYLPRAKALFAARRIAWPQAFADATRRWLKHAADLDV
jgi:hypothetical protein